MKRGWSKTLDHEALLKLTKQLVAEGVMVVVNGPARGRRDVRWLPETLSIVCEGGSHEVARARKPNPAYAPYKGGASLGAILAAKMKKA